jgi:hypothetical protein
VAGTRDIPELDRKALRQFGLVTGALVAGLFGLLLPWLLGRGSPLWPWAVCGVLVVWSAVAPAALRPVYRGWMRFGLLMSKVMVPFLMGLTFFLVVTPVALIRRAFARDEIHKHPDPAASTYRIASRKADPEQLRRPF